MEASGEASGDKMRGYSLLTLLYQRKALYPSSLPYTIRHDILEYIKAIKYPVQNTESVFTLNIRPFFRMFSYS